MSREVEDLNRRLRETDRGVTDICLDVGFTSLGTFSRTFREIVGETPSAYRRGNGSTPSRPRTEETSHDRHEAVRQAQRRGRGG